MGIFLEVVGVVLVFAYAYVNDAPIDILYVAGIFALAGAIEEGLKNIGSGTVYKYLKTIILAKSKSNDTTKYTFTLSSTPE